MTKMYMIVKFSFEEICKNRQTLVNC